MSRRGVHTLDRPINLAFMCNKVVVCRYLSNEYDNTYFLIGIGFMSVLVLSVSQSISLSCLSMLFKLEMHSLQILG